MKKIVMKSVIAVLLSAGSNALANSGLPIRTAEDCLQRAGGGTGYLISPTAVVYGYDIPSMDSCVIADRQICYSTYFAVNKATGLVNVWIVDEACVGSGHGGGYGE
jgi:hypothetical protein